MDPQLIKRIVEAALLASSQPLTVVQLNGLFPLDDTERALEALRHTQPITLRRFGAWLVMIDVATRQA